MRHDHYMLGSTEESYGAIVWVSRIENLQAHFHIIRDHLPDEAAWLRNQVQTAIDEAKRYIADYSPLAATPPDNLIEGE